MNLLTNINSMFRLTIQQFKNTGTKIFSALGIELYFWKWKILKFCKKRKISLFYTLLEISKVEYIRTQRKSINQFFSIGHYSLSQKWIFEDMSSMLKYVLSLTHNIIEKFADYKFQYTINANCKLHIANNRIVRNIDQICPIRLLNI